MEKEARIHIRVDHKTKKTLMRACDTLDISLTRLLLKGAFEFLNKQPLLTTMKKQIKENIRHQEFLECSSSKTRRNNYRHQIYNACDNVLMFASKSLRQQGFVSMPVVKSIIKDWKPVLKKLPLDMRKLFKEEIKFFYSLDDEKKLQDLFQNQKDSTMVSTENIFRKMKLISSDTRLLSKHEIKGGKKNA